MINWIKNNPTLTIAIYGAILSTIAIGWNIYNTRQDRPKVRVSAYFGIFGHSKGAEGPFFIVEAINKGRRSVHLSSVGLKGEKGNLINTTTLSLPYELKEGKSHSEWFKIEELKDREFNFVWYRDETGKIYKSGNIKKELANYFNSKKN